METDHDLIVEHTVSIRHLCRLVEGMREDLTEHTKKMDITCLAKHEHINDSLKTFVTMPTFKWIIGILILIMLGLGSAVTINKVGVTSNSLHIDHVLERVNNKAWANTDKE